jgi:UDPglucose 6-dehydrogenase
MKIGFYGLSHLGLVHLVTYATKGFTVVGFDPDQALVKELVCDDWVIREPGLFQTYLDNLERISLTSDLSEFLKSDVIYFSEDIPTNSSAKSDFSSTERAIESVIGSILECVPLILLSQVPPGFTRKYADRHANFYYQVETLVFGDALDRCKYPERIIVGTSQENLENIKISSILSEFQCPIIWMDYESAELTKISINMYLANSVSLTNALSEFSKKIGADWNKVKLALQLDKRIGKNAYLSPGLGLSGGNIERDIETLRSLSAPESLINRLAAYFQESSAIRRTWLRLQVVKVLVDPNLEIALLGVTYKPETNSVKNSIPLEVLNEFRANIPYVYDPAFVNNDDYQTANSIWDCIKDSEVLVIGTPWKDFFGIEPLIQKSKVRIVIDPFDVLDPTKLTFIEQYLSLTREFHK